MSYVQISNIYKYNKYSFVTNKWRLKSVSFIVLLRYSFRTIQYIRKMFIQKSCVRFKSIAEWCNVSSSSTLMCSLYKWNVNWPDKSLQKLLIPRSFQGPPSFGHLSVHNELWFVYNHVASSHCYIYSGTYNYKLITSPGIQVKMRKQDVFEK